MNFSRSKITCLSASWLLLGVSNYGLAANVNMLSCNPAGFMISGCKLESGTVLNHPNFDSVADEVVYTVNYDFTCGPGVGSNTLDISLDAGERSPPARLSFGQIETLQVTGSGDLLIHDNNPERTSNSLFTRSCHLLFTSEPTVAPSDRQLAQWAAERDILKTHKLDYQAALGGFEAVTDLAQGFLLVQQLSTTFYNKLTSDELQSLRAAASVNSQMLSAILSKSKDINLAQDEVLALINLKVVLESLDRADDWKNSDGSPKSLSDVLGPDDKKSFDAIAVRVSPATIDDSKTNADHFRNLILSTESRIAKLNRLLGA